MAYVQEQMFSVTVTVDDVPIQDPFDKFDGGEIDSNAKTYSAGGMAFPEALAGTPTVGEVTVSRGFRGERDAPLKRWLNGKVGKSIVIGKQALNPDKTPVDDGLETFKGIVKSVTTPTHDSEGDSVTMFAITAVITGLPS